MIYSLVFWLLLRLLILLMITRTINSTNAITRTLLLLLLN